MKKLWIYSLLSITVILLTGCTSGSVDGTKTEEVTKLEKAEKPETVAKEVIKEEVEEKSVEVLKKEALDFPVTITGKRILIQDDEFKALYPDLFSVAVINNTEVDIRDYEVAVMAWDSNDLPLKIKGQFYMNDDKYIVSFNAADVNLIPGATDGDKSGLPLDQEMKDLHTLEAVILNYTDFDNNIVENEAAQPFLDRVEGKTLK